MSRLLPNSAAVAGEELLLRVFVMPVALQWLSGGVLNRPEGATIAGGDGALNLAVYLPDANPPSDPAYAHRGRCREEEEMLEDKSPQVVVCWSLERTTFLDLMLFLSFITAVCVFRIRQAQITDRRSALPTA